MCFEFSENFPRVILELVPPSTFVEDFVTFWREKKILFTDISLQVEDQVMQAHKV
jgi:hypothetical protein